MKATQLLFRALRLFLGSCLAWRTCRSLAKNGPHYRVVPRDGFLFIEPRA